MLSTLLQIQKSCWLPFSLIFISTGLSVYDLKDKDQDDDIFDDNDVISLNWAFNGFWEWP